MKIKITPLNPSKEHVEAEIKLSNNYYWGKFYSCGIITEVLESDDWIESEVFWITKTELRFVVSLLSTMIDDNHMHLVSGFTPVLGKYTPITKIIEVDEFPDNEKCRQLIDEYCDIISVNCEYKFYKRNLDITLLQELYSKFTLSDKLLLRASASLLKSYLLINLNSSTFAEEIYLNLYRVVEAIKERVKLRENIGNTDAVNYINTKLISIKPNIDFISVEEEMRESIRNDIAHPYRDKYEEEIDQPFMMADYYFEDLEFVGWLLKQYILGKV